MPAFSTTIFSISCFNFSKSKISQTIVFIFLFQKALISFKSTQIIILSLIIWLINCKKLPGAAQISITSIQGFISSNLSCISCNL
jgi:hypothetical protein